MHTLTDIDVYRILGKDGKTIEELFEGLRRSFGTSRMSLKICLMNLEKGGLAKSQLRENGNSPGYSRHEERNPERELEYFLTEDGLSQRGVYDSVANARRQRLNANSTSTRHY